MSTQPPEDGSTEDHDPGPPTLDDLVDDLRESGVAVPIRPSYQSSSTKADAVTARTQVPNASIMLRRDDAEELGLEPRVLAHLTVNDYSSVTLTTEADADGEHYEAGGTVELSPNAARELAIQLLASAAVADRDTDGPPGYLTE